jgi:filamentous hemagglutinin family protein
MPFAAALRRLLLAGTALVPLAALAQAPDARPDLGRVVVGGITIEQDAALTAITQTQRRGIVEWRRFDVGRDHRVEFRQPDARAVTLNRVEARDPSLIAGRITANGQLVIVNRSGVVFQQGAQVEAAGLVVSTADIADEAFLAGRMAFDRPGEPQARVENHGRITVREAGLAALVAPRVANSGVISARLGRVVLAGAEAHTVDLHGDGLFEIEITRPVSVAPAGGGPLVENTGTLLAEGGRVRLTAAAADGIVQDLVRAGGRIAADTDAATGRTGDVVIAGTGGAIRIQGEVTARGTAPGTRGGAVEVLGNRVLAEPGAVVDVSGRAGGGEIAFGITRQGAAERRLAERTGVAQGARLNASATGQGDGGTIVVHSTHYTAVAGEIAARGGPEGGHGGFVEVSGERGLLLTRAPDVSAPAGAPGTVLLDPVDLTIVADGDPRINIGPGDIADGVLGEAEGPDNAFIGAGLVGGFVGSLRLEASNDITVAAQVQAGDSAGTLTLAAGRDVAVEAGLLDFPNIRLQAGRDILVNALLRTGNNEALEELALTAGRGIRLAADIRTDRLSLGAGPGGILQTAGVLRASNLRVVSGGDALLPSVNEVGLLFGFDVAGDFRLDVGDVLLVPQQNSQARTITLRSAGTMQFFGEAQLTATGGGSGRITLQAPAITAPEGTLTPAARLVAALVEVAPIEASPVEVGVAEPSLGAFAVSPNLLSSILAPTLRIGGATVDGVLLVPATGIQIAGPVAVPGTLDLRTTGDVTQVPGAALVIGRLVGDVGGALALDEFANVFGELGDLSAGGDLLLVSARDLILPPGRTLSAGGELRLLGFGDRIRIDGTAIGQSVDMLASGLLAVTGNSIIATGGPIFLSGAQVTLDGTLIATGGEIFIGAGDSATLAGSVFASGGLVVSAPVIGLGGLSAGSTDVTLRLSDSGFASGLLAARSLLVSGGAGAEMTGTVAGIGGRPAAARVVRGPPDGDPYGDPPPNAGDFLFNGCEMGVAACAATPDLPRPEDPDLPAEPPARLRPPALALVFQPPRDPSEEEEQAAPDIRAADF